MFKTGLRKSPRRICKGKGILILVDFTVRGSTRFDHNLLLHSIDFYFSSTDHSPLRQSRKHVCHSFELSHRNDSQNTIDHREKNVSDKQKGHASSDSSLLQPVYARTETRHGKLIPAPESGHGEQHRRPSGKSSKKRNQLEIYSSSSDNQSESDEVQHKETFEKRKRHKTKTDRYEPKKKAKPIVEEKNVVKKVKKFKRGDAAKASRKAGEDLVRSFTSKSIAQERLTVG